MNFEKYEGHLLFFDDQLRLALKKKPNWFHLLMIKLFFGGVWVDGESK